MFNGKRRFDGRQGEQIYNEELFKIYEILKHFLDEPTDYTKGPDSDLEEPGALWLDKQTSPNNAHLMYKDNNTWRPVFDDWLSLIRYIRNPDGKPDVAREGQLWISDEGILNWFNGSMFVPIKSRVADTVDYDVSAFENFLIIDPLTMSGGYIVDNISTLARTSNDMTQWGSGKEYKIGDMVYHTTNGKITFYKYTDSNIAWQNATYLSGETIEVDIDLGYLETVDLKSQYLIPSEVMDRIFIDGFYVDSESYERQSDVCIQISLNSYQGKTVAASHVNPTALKSMKKRIIKIDKTLKSDGTPSATYGLIKVNTNNTEFYGILKSFGQFLIKNKDYDIVSNGIKLKDSAVKYYDFVYCISYEYSTLVKNSGKLYKNTLDLLNQTCIWLGITEQDLKSKILIFSQGLCLEDFYYEYDEAKGLLKFDGYDSNGKLTNDPYKMVTPLFESKTDLAIVEFNNKTTLGVLSENLLSNEIVDPGETSSAGTYIDESGITKYIASIPIPSDVQKPLLFVSGMCIDLYNNDGASIVDGNIILKNVKPGSSYYIVDMILDGFDMYCQSGIVDETCTITITDRQLIFKECKPILFVSGMYISSGDIDLSNPSVIKIHGLVEGQEYTLLKSNSQLLFDNAISFTTIPLDNNIDDALLFAESSLIIDGGACTTTSTDTSNAVDNEIKYIKTATNEGWYEYSEEYGTWNPITNEDSKTLLDMSTTGYTVNSKTLNVLQNLGNVNCTYYAYKFANSIEQPLIKDYTDNYEIQDNVVLYKINDKYPLTKNALSVWINGIKQNITEYHDSTNDVYGFTMSVPTDENNKTLDIMPTAFYIIEKPETNENKSCVREFLSQSTNYGLYTTTSTILSPGVPRLFIDGYRQPQNSYVINDSNTFTLLEPALGPDNQNVITTDKNGNTAVVTVDSKSIVEIEIRQDYRLNEQTIILTDEAIENITKGNVAVLTPSIEFYNSQTLKEEIFSVTASEVCIYFNGASCGREFEIDQESKTITIEISKLCEPNDGSNTPLKANDKITFEWR